MKKATGNTSVTQYNFNIFMSLCDFYNKTKKISCQYFKNLKKLNKPKAFL